MGSTDRRSSLFKSYDQAVEIVGGVHPEQLNSPTPCQDYDVAALIDHLVGAGHRAAALGRGESSTTEEFPHVELDQARDELRRAAKDARSAWSDDSRLGADIAMPWGETFSGSTVVDMYLSELAGHAWDLARATGQLGRLDPSLGPLALEAATAMLRPEYRNAMAPGSPFGDEVTPPADADGWERFAAFMGRDPRFELGQQG